VDGAQVALVESLTRHGARQPCDNLGRIVAHCPKHLHHKRQQSAAPLATTTTAATTTTTTTAATGTCTNVKPRSILRNLSLLHHGSGNTSISCYGAGMRLHGGEGDRDVNGGGE